MTKVTTRPAKVTTVAPPAPDFQAERELTAASAAKARPTGLDRFSEPVQRGARAFMAAARSIHPVPMTPERDVDYPALMAAFVPACAAMLHPDEPGRAGFLLALAEFVGDVSEGSLPRINAWEPLDMMPVEVGERLAREMTNDLRPVAEHAETDGLLAKRERENVALRACYQIESTADALLWLIENDPDDPAAQARAVTSLTVRTKALNSVVMSVFGGDDDRETSEMEGVVSGCPAQQPGRVVRPGVPPLETATMAVTPDAARTSPPNIDAAAPRPAASLEPDGGIVLSATAARILLAARAEVSDWLDELRDTRPNDMDVWMALLPAKFKRMSDVNSLLFRIGESSDPDETLINAAAELGIDLELVGVAL